MNIDGDHPINISTTLDLTTKHSCFLVASL